MTDLHPIRRALLSVSDKTGLIELAQALAARGVELLSTGGSAKTLRDAGLAVRDVADVTGFPEMMDGRVKTLHPNVHGGLLALRDDAAHQQAMEQHGIGAIDLLVVNLYPFEAALARGAAYDEMIENIDIGGPAMIRAAAKNHAFVNVVVDVEDYQPLLDEMAQHDGQTSFGFRQRLAQIAYARTGAYDAAVSSWMADAIGEVAPRRRVVAGQLAQTLRYGENPHQQAAFYVDGSARAGVATARQHQGKELSYNNINDTDAAFELVAEFDPADGPACAIIKHANPCGVARGTSLLQAYRAAFDCDRTSAFLNVYQLRDIINTRLLDYQGESLSLLIESFGFKRGVPTDADIVFDARLLPNPHWSADLRLLSGKDEPVIEFLDSHVDCGNFVESILAFLIRWLPLYQQSQRSYFTVAVGCTGGQHRSVYVAEKLFETLRPIYTQARIRHRELAPVIAQ